MAGDGFLFGGGVGLFTIAAVFLFALAVLWFVLPFAIFGTKPILSDILKTQRQILAELRRQNSSGEQEVSPMEGLAVETVFSPTDIVSCAACGKETYGGQDMCPHCEQPLRIAPKISPGSA